MSEELKGTEALKAELDLGFAVFNVIKQAKADGKIGVEDLALLLGLIGPVEKAYNMRLEVGAEAKDLSVEEAGELVAYAAGKLGVAVDEKLSTKVVATMKALQAMYAAYKAYTA